MRGGLCAILTKILKRTNPADLEDSRRRDEIDRLVPKQAAEAEADHVLPQFIAVIDNCSTVAIDTHTKYGP